MGSAAVYGTPDRALAAAAVDVLRSRLRRRGVAICISGMDGSGKTTLADELQRTWSASDISVSHLRIYQWYMNFVAIPFLLCRNRYFDRKLLIFDRTIFDNLAVIGIRRPFRGWLLRVMTFVVTLCYPSFDFYFCLQASPPEIHRRRPEASMSRIEALGKSYHQVTRQAPYIQLWSDPTLLGAVLSSVSASTGK